MAPQAGQQSASRPAKDHAQSSPRPASFSFTRFEPAFRDICRDMEVDGRRAAFAAFAERARRDAAQPPPFRAFWRSVFAACRDSTFHGIGRHRLFQTPNPEPSEVSGQPQEGHTTQAASSEPAEGDRSATPLPEPAERSVVVGGGTSHPLERGELKGSPDLGPNSALAAAKLGRGGDSAQRHPSTEVLDRISRLSIELYDLDMHGSGYLPGITAAQKALESSTELSLAEREYFSTLGTYLTSAWESAGLAATPTPSQDQIGDLFE